jgi:methionyl-tRNA formyltransferase
MVLDAGLDTGPTVATWSTGLAPTENAGELLDRMAVRGAELVQQVVGPYLDGRLVAIPQPEEGTVAPKITSDDRLIDWTAPAVDCVRRVRALAPRPGASTRLGGEPFKVLEAEAVSGSAAPGTVDGVAVGTGSGLVRLVTVQPAGRTPMSAQDWRRGLGDRVTEFG